ncbi:MAG: S8 family serine peptidase [Solirubrobacteraceae bacterium]|nr:S8 family serine peptidase [Solirubrobacteraceae bacterium]
MDEMANRGGRLLALGAAAALAPLLAIGPSAVAASSSSDLGAAASSSAGLGAASSPSTNRDAASPTGSAQTSAVPAPRGRDLPVRGNELLVRPRGGALQRVTLRADADPVAVAAELRKNTAVIASAGANLIATAAGVPTALRGAAAQATTPTNLTPVQAPVTDDLPSAPANLRGWIPNDHIGDVPWTELQWNFIGPFGIRATEAWAELRTRPARSIAGRGVRVAVIDSGIAYRSRGDYRASPDVDPERVLTGYDFVDEDRYPDDLSGHGTHVASLIAGATDNDAGLTGIAYNADILPVRVLDESDEGDVVSIARGIRYAVRRQADVINLSVDFPVSATAEDIPEVMDAIDYARREGVLVVASSGNDGIGEVALPARSSSVLSVGATTVNGCRSAFSNAGAALDLVAPGGGIDHRSESGSRCRPGAIGPPIPQITLVRAGNPTLLGVPLNYVGTSMAAAHVTAIAAIVRASGVLGKDPSPGLLAAYLVRSTRDLGPKGRDARYGAGLIDAAAAVNRRTGKAAVRGAKRAVANASRTRTALPVR